MNDLIVVGGGLAGLAAATWCARGGLGVVLLERASVVGGRARTDIQAGHAFNLGAHALYVNGPAFRGLRELGVTFSGRPPPTSGLLGVARGEIHRFPAGLLSMIATDLFGVGGKIDAARALATLARIDPRPLRDVTWGEWLQRVVPREEVRDAVHALARVTTYANAPQRASAGATIAQVKRGISPGVLYLDGGWQTLVDGLEAAAIAAGVRVLRSARATSLVGDDCARGVIADGERIAAHAVLLATGPTAAQTVIGCARRTLTNGSDLLTLCAACLDLGLVELPRPERLVAFGLDRPVYFSVHSASAHLANSGATVHLMKYLDPDEPEDAAGAERELEELADRIQPGWRDRVAARRFLPSLVTSNALVAAGTRRPTVEAPGLPGAYVAGDWVGEEGMLADAAIASARAAASRITEYVGRARAQTSAAAANMSVA
jgi:phytoene dehydrogenase-like protein